MHHYYICTATHWVMAPTLIEAIEKLPRRTEPFDNFCFMNIWQVPGAYEDRRDYGIVDYAPQVDERVLIYAHNGAKEITHDPDES